MEKTMRIDRSIEDSLNSITNEKASLRDYYDVTKPGIVRSNVFAAIAAFMVGMSGRSYTIDTLWLFLITVVGIGLVVAAACVFNNVYDRDIDRIMERTHERAIVKGRISTKSGIIYGSILIVVGAMLLFFVNPLTAILGLIGFFFYTVVYTIWLKRTTTLNTVVGAIPGSMPFLVGYVAVTNQLDTIAWLMFAFMSLWQIPHFLALAMRRVEEYREVNVPMLPVISGFKVTKRQIFVYTGAMVISSLLLYTSGALGVIYLWTAIALGAIYMVLASQGMFTDVKEKDMKWATKMFAYSIIYLTLMLFVMMVDALLV